LAGTFPWVIPLPTFARQLAAYRVVFLTYDLTMAGRTLGWLVGPKTRPGVALFAFGMALAAGGWLLVEISGARWLAAPLGAAIGLAFAAPFARGRLVIAVRGMLAVVATVAGWRLAASAVDALAALAASGTRLTAPSPILLAGAGISALQALVWGICARVMWRAVRRSAGGMPVTGLLAMLATCMSALCPPDTGPWILSPVAPPFPPSLSALSIARARLLL